MAECGCHLTDEGLLYVCPLHYGRMLEDSTVDYGLLTTPDEEFIKLHGIPVVLTEEFKK